MSQSWIKWR